MACDGVARVRARPIKQLRDRPNSDWFGLGIERLGLAALRYPVITCVLIVCSVVGTLLFTPYLSFDGDVTRLLKSERDSAKVYQRYVQNYPDLTAEIVLHVAPGSGSMMTPDSIGQLEDFTLELTFLDGVSSVLSPTSFRTIRGDRLAQIFNRDQTAKELEDALKSAADRHPEFIGMISANAALVFVNLKPGISKSNVALSALFSQLAALGDDGDLQIKIAGPAAIQSELIGELIAGQILIIILGSIAGVAIACAIFRDWRSVVLTTSATSISMIWVIGVMIAADQPFDAMTTILPIFASVLAFADSVHLIAELRRQPDDMPLKEALRRSVKTVGPATALTSVTTAIAFGTLAFGGAAMVNLAVFGAITSGLAMVSVLVVVPSFAALLLKWSGRPGALMSSVGNWIPLLTQLCCSVPRVVVTASVGLLAFVLWFHLKNEPSFHPHENLSANSAVRAASEQIDADFGGTRHIVVLVPLGADEDPAGPEARARLTFADNAVAGRLGRDATASAASLWRAIDAMDTVDPAMLRKLANAPGAVALDGSSMPILARIPAELSAADLRRLKAELDSDPELSATTITGFSVMSSLEALHVISNLKAGLLIAIIVTAIVVAIRLRSMLVFAALALANVLTVLLVEAIVCSAGLPADFTLYVALIIALGIGSDNAVHLLNAWRKECGSAFDAIQAAIARTAPALAISTIVLSANLLVTLTSDLRPVWLIGGVVSATLFVALSANVVVLPCVLALGRTRQKRG